jgi:PAS domain S-box-containing protein
MALFDRRDGTSILLKSLPPWAVLAAGGLAYFLAAELGIALATDYHPVSPIWPAAGLAVAMVWQFGVRVWPAILAGAFAANALAIDPITALLMATGSTMQAAVGGTILRRMMERQSDTFILARTLGYVLAGTIAPVISATIGVASLGVSGALTNQEVVTAWITWWAGDGLGVLVVTSALLSLRQRFDVRWSLPRAGTALGLLIALSAMLWWVHAEHNAAPVVFLAFPLVFVASRSFGAQGGTWLVLAIAAGLVLETASGSGPFSGGALSDNLLDMQIFVGVLALAAVVFVDLQRFELRIPGAVFIAGTVVAMIAAVVEQHRAVELESLRFKQLTEMAAERIRERTVTYTNAVRSAASLFAGSKEVTRSDWHNFVASLTIDQRYPGIVGFGVVVPVTPEQADSFVAAQRADGAPDFTIRPFPGVVAVPETPIGERFVVQFLEPAVANSGALGIDVASEPHRRGAAIASRESGLPAISGPVVLASDPRKRLGFHLYFPVYDTPTSPTTLDLRRAHFRNWVFGRFVIQDFFESALMPLGNALVGEIFDGGDVDEGKLLLSTWSVWGVKPTTLGLNTTQTLPLAGHLFTVRWHAGPGFVLHNHRLMTVIGSVILLLTILLVALVANLQSLRQRAAAIAERMTGELAATNERFALALAGTRDGMWDWDLVDNRTWRSPRCREMLGYDADELPDHPAAWHAVLLEEDRESTQAAFARVKDGETDNLDVVQRYRHKDGRLVHLHNQAFAVRDAAGELTRLVGALTDITPLVQAQEQLRAAISVMEDGFGLFDAEDRIVLYNDAFMDEGSRKILGDDVTGRKFEDIVRAFAYHDMPVNGAGFDREDWIARRMELHRNPPESPIEVQWGGGRWMRISERRTSDGGYVGIWTDITAVKIAELRLIAAIETMPDGFALFDADDRLLYHNKGFIEDGVAKHFPDPRGHTFEEIIRTFTSNDVTAVEALLDREEWIKRRVAKHRSPSLEPFEQQRTDGKWYRIAERRTADGGYVGIWTDITALKSAEARLRDAIESINEGFALFDAEMRFVIANSNFAKMYPVSGKLAKQGERLEDMLSYGADNGEYPGVVTPEQADAFVQSWLDRFASGERYLGEGEMPDGRWYLVSHHPTSSGGYVSIRADITAQKTREAALSEAMADLEVKTLELAVLADELEQARRLADLANAGKSTFLANMAHELRTPLNAINGFSELILNETFGAIQPERYKSYVDYIHQGGSHLLSLINDILDLSKVEAGKMELHFEAVPSEQVAYQAVESLRKTADDRKVVLQTEVAHDCPIVHADPRAVRQILLNLLSNAVKFTPAQGSVTLSMQNGSEKGIRITVADTGIGMTDAEVSKALEPYGQVESDLARKQQGTGLGLPLVKSLTELHGGSMSVRSEKGKGTTVTVLLPWQPDLPRALH